MDGSTLTLTFNEEMDPGATPGRYLFDVTVNGDERYVAPGGVAIDGKTVRLTLASAVSGGETVKVRYTKPSGNPLRGTDGLAVDRLDGLYVVRTSLPSSELDGPGTVRAYKRLSSVERMETLDPNVRPVFHRSPGARPRLPVHACLALAPEAQARAVRRRGGARRRGPAGVRRCPGEEIHERPGQGGNEDNA